MKGYFLRPNKEKSDEVVYGVSKVFPGAYNELFDGCLIVKSDKIQGFLKQIREWNNLHPKRQIIYDVYPLPGQED